MHSKHPIMLRLYAPHKLTPSPGAGYALFETACWANELLLVVLDENARWIARLHFAYKRE
jgi:hypothetical protein